MTRDGRRETHLVEVTSFVKFSEETRTTRSQDSVRSDFEGEGEIRSLGSRIRVEYPRRQRRRHRCRNGRGKTESDQAERGGSSLRGEFGEGANPNDKQKSRNPDSQRRRSVNDSKAPPAADLRNPQFSFLGMPFDFFPLHKHTKVYTDF